MDKGQQKQFLQTARQRKTDVSEAFGAMGIKHHPYTLFLYEMLLAKKEVPVEEIWYELQLVTNDPELSQNLTELERTYSGKDNCSVSQWGPATNGREIPYQENGVTKYLAPTQVEKLLHEKGIKYLHTLMLYNSNVLCWEDIDMILGIGENVLH